MLRNQINYIKLIIYARFLFSSLLSKVKYAKLCVQYIVHVIVKV